MVHVGVACYWPERSATYFDFRCVLVLKIKPRSTLSSNSHKARKLGGIDSATDGVPALWHS